MICEDDTKYIIYGDDQVEWASSLNFSYVAELKNEGASVLVEWEFYLDPIHIEIAGEGSKVVSSLIITVFSFSVMCK